MDTLSYKTKSANKETVDKQWVLIDAEDQILGRLSSVVANLLRGKHKPNFTPHVDCGDNVIVINAEKIRLTGKKWEKKNYITYSGYPGGQKSKTARQIYNRFPERLIEHAVKGMLPKNRLSNRIFHNLYVYTGENHNQQAQKPKKIQIHKLI